MIVFSFGLEDLEVQDTLEYSVSSTEAVLCGFHVFIYIYINIRAHPPPGPTFSKQMERTWQFQFRGDDTCQGCTTDALKQKSIVWKVRFHYWTKF